MKVNIQSLFDSINHQVLFSKLEFYGIRGLALQWLQNYLSDRSQFVFFDGESSPEMELVCGVPQGSILGPLLFLLYINDLPHASTSLSCVLFADDTNVFMSNDSLDILVENMNCEIQKINLWYKVNGLRINTAKTNFMHFAPLNKRYDRGLLTLKLDDSLEPLKQVHSTRFLGVCIDDKLSWSSHINDIALKISRVIGIMYKLKHVLPSNILLLLYNSLVLPHISYGNMLWINSSNSLLNRLYLLQKRALRIVAKTHYLAHTLHLFRQFRVLTVFELSKLQLGEFMFKHDKGLLPKSFQNWYICNSGIHLYNTRNNKNLHSIYFRTNTGQKSVKYQGYLMWNSLDQNLKKCVSLRQFKRKYKEAIFKL